MAAETYGFYNNSPFFALVEGFASQRTTVVARYPNDEVVASGWLRGEELMTGRAAVVSVEMNPGRIVLFGLRPQHRAQTHATFPMLFNALYLSADVTRRTCVAATPQLGLRRALLDGLDDVPGRDAVALEQLLGLAAARDLADGEPVDGKAGGDDRLADRVAQAAGRVVILDGDDPAAASPCAARDQRGGVDRLQRIGVDDADVDALR